MKYWYSPHRVSHAWSRDVNSSTATLYSVLMNYDDVYRRSAETADRHAAVDTLWTRCGHDTTSSCLFVLINISATLHHLIECYIECCVASNVQRGYKRNQLQIVMCRAAWSQELFSNHVIVMADKDVFNVLSFESETIPSVSVIVTCLGALASLWRAR